MIQYPHQVKLRGGLLARISGPAQLPAGYTFQGVIVHNTREHEPSMWGETGAWAYDAREHALDIPKASVRSITMAAHAQ